MEIAWVEGGGVRDLVCGRGARRVAVGRDAVDAALGAYGSRSRGRAMGAIAAAA